MVLRDREQATAVSERPLSVGSRRATACENMVRKGDDGPITGGQSWRVWLSVLLLGLSWGFLPAGIGSAAGRFSGVTSEY